MEKDYITILNKKIKLSEITIDEMPNEVMQEVYAICGIDTAIKLLLYFQGNNIQVPTKAFKKIEKKLIYKYYDNSMASIRKMTREMGVSENYIREILKNPPVEGQLNFLLPNNGIEEV